MEVRINILKSLANVGSMDIGVLKLKLHLNSASPKYRPASPVFYSRIL